jgi:hypothetical protein
VLGTASCTLARTALDDGSEVFEAYAALGGNAVIAM